MKYLNTILSSSDIDSTTASRIKENYSLVQEQLKKLQIVFDNDNSEMIFTNHIISLVKRILNHDFIDDIDENMMHEISSEAMALALSLVEPVFKRNQCNVSQSEVFLVATHMQLYLNNKKEEINHE